MKYLIIENGRAFYSVDEVEMSKKSIDQISKEDLLKLIEICLEKDDFEMDEFDVNKVQNAAHQIIYKNIYQKLSDLVMRRVSFQDEKNSLYRTAIAKYSSELSDK